MTKTSVLPHGQGLDECMPRIYISLAPRYCVKRIQTTSSDSNVLTIRTGGQPLQFVKVVKPVKEIKTADDAVRRKHHKPHRDVTKVQVIKFD